MAQAAIAAVAAGSRRAAAAAAFPPRVAGLAPPCGPALLLSALWVPYGRSWQPCQGDPPGPQCGEVSHQPGVPARRGERGEPPGRGLYRRRRILQVVDAWEGAGP